MSVLCFESGGTKLVAALAGAEGGLRERIVESRPAAQVAEGTLAQLVRMGHRLTGSQRLDAVGFGFGGTVRRGDGRPLYCYHESGWGSVDAARVLGSEFKVPVFIENDCNLAALAEAWAVDKPPAASLFYVTVGTGIGGGAVCDGKILRLGEVGEAEIGHLVVEPRGLACECGNRGCLEMYCSGPGLENLAELLTGRRSDSRAIMTAFRSGDPSAGKTAEAAAGYLATSLAAAIGLFAPQHIVLGGGVMTDNEPFLDLIRERTLALSFPPIRDQIREFRLSRCGRDVVCLGAARYALQNLTK